MFENQGSDLVDFVSERVDFSELGNGGQKKSLKLEKKVTKLKKKMTKELNKVALHHTKDVKKKEKEIVKLKTRNDALERFNLDL